MIKIGVVVGHTGNANGKLDANTVHSCGYDRENLFLEESKVKLETVQGSSGTGRRRKNSLGAAAERLGKSVAQRQSPAIRTTDLSRPVHSSRAKPTAPRDTALDPSSNRKLKRTPNNFGGIRGILRRIFGRHKAQSVVSIDPKVETDKAQEIPKQANTSILDQIIPEDKPLPQNTPIPIRKDLEHAIATRSLVQRVRRNIIRQMQARTDTNNQDKPIKNGINDNTTDPKDQEVLKRFEEFLEEACKKKTINRVKKWGTVAEQDIYKIYLNFCKINRTDVPAQPRIYAKDPRNSQPSGARLELGKWPELKSQADVRNHLVGIIEYQLAGKYSDNKTHRRQPSAPVDANNEVAVGKYSEQLWVELSKSDDNSAFTQFSDDIYKKYLDFCKKNSLQPLSQQAVSSNKATKSSPSTPKPKKKVRFVESANPQKPHSHHKKPASSRKASGRVEI